MSFSWDTATERPISAVPAARRCCVPQTVLARTARSATFVCTGRGSSPTANVFCSPRARDDGEGELRIGQLDGATHTVTRYSVMRVSSNAQWIDPDVVVFAREGVLMAQRVDLKQSRPVGEPFSIADQVEYFFTTSRAMFSASPTGTIAYHPGGDLMQLVWADRNGNENGTIGKPAAYDPGSSRLSRDGRKLLTARRQPGLGGYDIWRLDLGPWERTAAHIRTRQRGDACLDRRRAFHHLRRRQRRFPATPVSQGPRFRV